MNKNTFALRGDIVYSGADRTFQTRKNSLLVCEGGLVAGIFDQLPGKYSGIPVKDAQGGLIIPV